MRKFFRVAAMACSLAMFVVSCSDDKESSKSKADLNTPPSKAKVIEMYEKIVAESVKAALDPDSSDFCIAVGKILKDYRDALNIMQVNSDGWSAADIVLLDILKNWFSTCEAMKLPSWDWYYEAEKEAEKEAKSCIIPSGKLSRLESYLKELDPILSSSSSCIDKAKQLDALYMKYIDAMSWLDQDSISDECADSVWEKVNISDQLGMSLMAGMLSFEACYMQLLQAGWICDGFTCYEPDPCWTKICGAGQYCSNGACIAWDPCDLLICPDKHVCSKGMCISTETPVETCTTKPSLCTSSQECKSGVCVEKGGETCATKPDICNEYQKCESSRCVSKHVFATPNFCNYTAMGYDVKKFAEAFERDVMPVIHESCSKRTEALSAFLDNNGKTFKYVTWAADYCIDSWDFMLVGSLMSMEAALVFYTMECTDPFQLSIIDKALLKSYDKDICDYKTVGVDIEGLARIFEAAAKVSCAQLDLAMLSILSSDPALAAYFEVGEICPSWESLFEEAIACWDW